MQTENKISVLDKIADTPCLYRNDMLRSEVIVLASFILSLVIIAFHPVVNNDGILYLLVARDFLDGGIHAAYASYSWPFYSIAIALFHQLTTLPLHLVAYVVTSCCFALLSYAFVKVIKELGGSRRAQLIALMIILFQPIMGDYRANFVRDPGFLAFMLLALSALISYQKTPLIKWQLGWFGSAALAFLFRPEMLVIALSAPMIFLFDGGSSFRRRIKTAVQFSLLPVLLSGVSIGLVWFSQPELLEKARPVTEAIRYADKLVDLELHLTAVATVLSKELLVYTAVEDAIYAVYAALFAVLLVNIVRALTPIYVMSLLFFRYKQYKLPIDEFGNAVIVMHVVVILCYLIGYLLTMGFMLERYCFPIVVLLLLYLTFYTDNLLSQARKKHLVLAVFYLIITGYALDTAINSDYKKSYIAEAAQWIKESDEWNAPLITNQAHIAYFSQSMNKRSVGTGNSNKKLVLSVWQPGSIYALKLKAENHQKINIDSAIAFIAYVKKAVVIHQAVNGDGDRIVIFKVK